VLSVSTKEHKNRMSKEQLKGFQTALGPTDHKNIFSNCLKWLMTSPAVSGLSADSRSSCEIGPTDTKHTSFSWVQSSWAGNRCWWWTLNSMDVVLSTITSEPQQCSSHS